MSAGKDKSMKPLALAAILAATASPTLAQDCLATERMVEVLTQQYSEQPIAGGAIGTDGVFALYGNRDTGTWTLLRSEVGTGITCMVSSGSNFTIAQSLFGVAS